MNMEHNKLRAYKRVHYYRQEINLTTKLFSVKEYLKLNRHWEKGGTNNVQKN